MNDRFPFNLIEYNIIVMNGERLTQIYLLLNAEKCQLRVDLILANLIFAITD